MIAIKIQRINRVSHTETKNFLTKSTPTQVEGPKQYSSDRETKCIEEYAPKEITVWETKTVDLLEQNIEDESKFDLAAVIVAVNGLEAKRG